MHKMHLDLQPLLKTSYGKNYVTKQTLTLGRWDNEQTRKTSIYTAALGNDTGASKESNWSSNLAAIGTLINGWLD